MEYFEDKELVSFGPGDNWTVEDAMKGTSIMGATGSGKTSASGMMLAKSFLKAGWGGIVLCAKSGEAELWEQYCEDTGRSNDRIVFRNNSRFSETNEYMVFNPIDYEMKRTGEGAGETLNIVNIFMDIYRMGNRIASEGDTKEERYWDTALKRCLNKVIELLKMARMDLSYENMAKVIASCNEIKREEITKAVSNYQNNISINIDLETDFCKACLAKIYLDEIENNEDEEAAKAAHEIYKPIEAYFTTVMNNMGNRTKSVVTESFMGLAEPFLSGILGKHFAGKTNIFPERTYIENKIIILDFPVKEFLDTGIIAQCVFKLMFQQTIERRDIKKFPNPVFLWADEAHYFVNPYDQIFLTTARSSRCATVFLSQSVSNYHAVMGSGKDATARVDSLMGNFCTKIFHANSDFLTNEYASRLIGNKVNYLKNLSEQFAQDSLNTNFTDSYNASMLPQVEPREFTTLKTGGAKNDFIVQGVITINGREWSDGQNHSRIEINQRIKI